MNARGPASADLLGLSNVRAHPTFYRLEEKILELVITSSVDLFTLYREPALESKGVIHRSSSLSDVLGKGLPRDEFDQYLTIGKQYSDNIPFPLYRLWLPRMAYNSLSSGTDLRSENDSQLLCTADPMVSEHQRVLLSLPPCF